jgi:hypothetical protein
MKKLCVWMIEYGLTKAKAESPYTCMIFDMDGFSLFKMDYKFVKFIVDVFANYYPETLGCALILNSYVARSSLSSRTSAQGLTICTQAMDIFWLLEANKALAGPCDSLQSDFLQDGRCCRLDRAAIPL